jgi:hypothetical protein
MIQKKDHKEQAMTAVERYRHIRSFMVAAGVTNAQIARDEKVRAEYVYYVLKGDRTGYRIRRAIARAVNKPIEMLWPDTPPQYREAA